MLLNTLLLALRSIRRNLMRSFLTILGIVIGVSAVITMVTLGNGATMAVQNQISGLGTNLLQVRPGQRMGPGGGSGAPAFKDTDADMIAQQIGGILAVAPEARAAAQRDHGDDGRDADHDAEHGEEGAQQIALDGAQREHQRVPQHQPAPCCCAAVRLPGCVGLALRSSLATKPSTKRTMRCA